jgi:hypothetical protein
MEDVHLYIKLAGSYNLKIKELFILLEKPT